MRDYIVKINVNGNLEKMIIAAENSTEAKEIAGRSGSVISIEKTSWVTNIIQPGMSAAERIIFLSRLSMMTRSRVGMGESLKIMKTAFKGTIARASNDLYRRVESGSDFGDAITSMRKDFPKTTSALISAGIKGGDISSALIEAADFETEMDMVKRESNKGVWSAVFSFILASAIILGTSIFLGPYVMESDLIKAAGPSVQVDWVFVVADVLAWIIGAITFIFTFLLLIGYVVKPVAPQAADKIILKIPVFRDLVLARNNYTIFFGMALLVRSGVRMEETLDLTYKSAPKGAIANDVQRAYLAVKSGQSWPKAMHHLHPTDIAALSVSQDREQIAVALSSVAEQYKRLYGERVKQVVPVLQLLSALFMSLGGALIFAMIILPMLQMTSGLM